MSNEQFKDIPLVVEEAPSGGCQLWERPRIVATGPDRGKIFACRKGIWADVTPGSDRAKAVLSVEQLDSIDTSPVELVPAPGAGKVIIPTRISTNYVVSESIGTPPNVSLKVWHNLLEACSMSSGINVNGDENVASDFLSGNGIPPNVALNLGGQVSSEGLGAIVAHALKTGGTGYVAGDTGKVVSDDTHNALYVVDTVGEDGEVLTYHLTNAGDEYQVAEDVETETGGGQAGVGTGFTIDITEVDMGDGVLYVVVEYDIVDLSDF